MANREHATALLIDNDEDLLDALQTRLESEGVRCIVANSGAQGVSLFEVDDVDVVITDLNMPEGDGVSVAEAIRARSDVPIIVITGFRDEYERRLRSLANVSVVRKPFDTRELIQLVSIAITMPEGLGAF
ncbi:MAG: response regulator [Phycisphaerales bacterium]